MPSMSFQEALSQILPLVEDEAHHTNIYLISLGFPGLSLKPFLVKLNAKLQAKALPTLKLAQLKFLLTHLGYHPNPRTWVPIARSLQIPWTKS